MRKSVHTPEYAALRAELRAARTAAGLTQRELAAALDVPHSVVAKIESGERRTDVIEFCWFLNICGADPTATFERVAAQVALRPRRKRGGGRVK